MGEEHLTHPTTLFEGSSIDSMQRSRAGVEQLRREWPAESPRAHALVLHGIAEHSGGYHHVGSTLAEAGISTRSYDHHGFGRSGGRRGHVPSFSVFLDDVEDNLTDLRDEGLPVILLGHSMGGLIAFSYAVSGRSPQPDVLLLSGPSLGAIIPAWQRLAAPVLGRIVPTVFVPADFDGSLLATDPGVGEFCAEDPLRIRGATAGLGKELLTAMAQANERVDRLAVPTLVLHGGDDGIVPPDSSAPIGDHPLAEREVLPGLRHEILNEPSWAESLGKMIAFADTHVGASESG